MDRKTKDGTRYTTGTHTHDTIEEHVQCKECAQKACDATTEDMSEIDQDCPYCDIHSCCSIHSENQHNTQPDPIPTDGKPVVDTAIELLQERKELGIKKYGTPLQTNNGRDALEDWHEEQRDNYIYSTQIYLTEKERRAKVAYILVHLRANLEHGEVNEHTFKLLKQLEEVLKW